MTPEEEVRDVMARYCWYVDHQQFAEWLGLFTPDVIWGARGSRLFEGAEAMTKLAAGLAKKAAAGSPQRHLTSNLLVEAQGDHATLKAYVAVVQTDTKAITTVGEQNVRLVKQDGQWRIEEMIFDNASPPQPAAARG